MARTPGPKAPKAEPTFKKLSLLQNIACADLLRAKCRLHDGFAIYDEGYDDARVAAEAIPEYTGDGRQSVAAMRVKLIGALRPAGNPSPAINDPALEKRVADLERQLSGLAAMLGVDVEGNSLKQDSTAVLDSDMRFL